MRTPNINLRPAGLAPLSPYYTRPDPQKQVREVYARFIHQLAKIDAYRIDIAKEAFRLMPSTIHGLMLDIDEVITNPVMLCREEGVEPTPENIAERS